MVHIIEESSAVAYPYLLKDVEGEKNILFFDPGDVKVLTIGSGGYEVRSVKGVTHLEEDADELTFHTFTKAMEPIKNALEVIGVKKNDIHRIVPVGRSSNIPKLRELLKDYFELRFSCMDAKLEDVVVYGAAAYSSNFNPNSLSCMDGINLAIFCNIYT